MSARIETLEFQAEARQLLRLVVHSIYSDKDIFLRELISNASDALDKVRLEAMLNKDLDVDLADPHIDIAVDKQARTLTVTDNGIGMSRDEVVQIVGTIARSGTAEFLRKLQQASDTAASRELIGQFGIGLYSAFMVADKVTLTTRRAGTDQATRWESTGEDTYTIETVDQAPQGTSITLHLKPADEEDHLYDYTSPWKIRELVKRYSDFIRWPIRMAVERPGEDGGNTTEVQTLNSMQAIWARPRDEVTQEEYEEFYRHISHDWNPPLEVIPVRAEGTFEYQALLFIPSSPPPDLFSAETGRGLHLYVKRVFIMDDWSVLMPPYLRFVRGVVDAQDLSLNISRELLQRDRQIQLMRRHLVRKVLSAVKSMMADNPDRYATFWTHFGRVVKEGLITDADNRAAILEICSFASTDDAERPTTLPDYVRRMRPGQDRIYYLTGESRSAVERSPHMEAFRAKSFEVLYLTDPVDDVWVDTVGSFDGRDLQSIARGQVDLDTEEERKAAEPEREQQRKDFAALLSWMGGTLGDDVKQVRLSTRLTTSPACVVTDEHDITPTLERMYRAMGQQVPPVRRILELNPGHPLVRRLRDAYQQRGADTDLEGVARLLHDLALLAEGGDLADPARFALAVADRLAGTV